MREGGFIRDGDQQGPVDIGEALDPHQINRLFVEAPFGGQQGDFTASTALAEAVRDAHDPKAFDVIAFDRLSADARRFGEKRVMGERLSKANAQPLVADDAAAGAAECTLRAEIFLVGQGIERLAKRLQRGGFAFGQSVAGRLL